MNNRDVEKSITLVIGNPFPGSPRSEFGGINLPWECICREEDFLVCEFGDM
jgi:hypothetical protein